MRKGWDGEEEVEVEEKKVKIAVHYRRQLTGTQTARAKSY